MMTRRMHSPSVQQAPAIRARREYVYFALALIVALLGAAIHVGLTNHATSATAITSP